MDPNPATASSHSFVFAVLGGFFAGVLLASFVFIPPLIALFAVLVGWAVILMEKALRRAPGREAILISIVLISFGCGALRYAVKDFHEPLTPSLTGVVVSEPERRDNATRFIFRADNGERALVYTDLYSPVEYGDQVSLNGQFKAPSVIEEEGREFDYARYLSKDDIYLTMSFAEVPVLSKGHGNPVLATLFKIKQRFVGKIREILPEPESSLLAGLLVAGKDAMPRDILDEFKRAGVVHIVVLSGYNLTIITDSLRRFFYYVLPRAALPASCAGILLFIFMTGAEATVVRAGLMVLAVMLGKSLGRRADAGRILVFAAFLMVLENPKVLAFDPSFQLSFLATLALIYVSPIVENYLGQVPEKFGLRGVVATTIATQAVVLPYLIYSMGDFSLVSLPANVLILLIIPWTMLAGFIAATLAFLTPVIALPFSYLAHVFLSWILFVSRVLGNLSFAAIKIPPVPAVFIIIAYLLMIILVKRVRNSLPHSAN